MNEYCEEHKFTAWFETSAKENINIEEAAKTLVKQVIFVFVILLNLNVIYFCVRERKIFKIFFNGS